LFAIPGTSGAVGGGASSDQKFSLMPDDETDVLI